MTLAQTTGWSGLQVGLAWCHRPGACYHKACRAPQDNKWAWLGATGHALATIRRAKRGKGQANTTKAGHRPSSSHDLVAATPTPGLKGGRRRHAHKAPSPGTRSPKKFPNAAQIPGPGPQGPPEPGPRDPCPAKAPGPGLARSGTMFWGRPCTGRAENVGRAKAGVVDPVPGLKWSNGKFSLDRIGQKENFHLAKQQGASV